MIDEIARISIARPCMICHVAQRWHAITRNEGKFAVWISLEFFLGILKNAILFEFSNTPLPFVTVLNFALMIYL